MFNTGIESLKDGHGSFNDFCSNGDCRTVVTSGSRLIVSGTPSHEGQYQHI